MRKTKITFLFRRMMLIVLAFLGYAAMTQAQVYVVDDFVNDSTPCYEYQLKEGKYLLPNDEPGIISLRRMVRSMRLMLTLFIVRQTTRRVWRRMIKCIIPRI